MENDSPDKIGANQGRAPGRHISTHVLDAVSGRPPAGVPLTLSLRDGTVLAEGDDDGWIASLYAGDLSGVHRLRFDITDAAGRYHLPVLLSPFSYTTYKGS